MDVFKHHNRITIMRRTHETRAQSQQVASRAHESYYLDNAIDVHADASRRDAFKKNTHMQRKTSLFISNIVSKIKV